MGIEKQQQPSAEEDEEVLHLQLIRRGGALVLRHRGLTITHNAPYLRTIFEQATDIEDLRGEMTDEEKAHSRMQHDVISSQDMLVTREQNTLLCEGDGPDDPFPSRLHEATSEMPILVPGEPLDDAPAVAPQPV